VQQYGAGPGKAQLMGRFVAEGLRQQLQHHSYLVQAQWPGQAAGGAALPDHVQHFHTLYPLEDLALADERISAALGIKSLVVKAVNAHDGLPYALRRVDGKQVGGLGRRAGTGLGGQGDWLATGAGCWGAAGCCACGYMCPPAAPICPVPPCTSRSARPPAPQVIPTGELVSIARQHVDAWSVVSYHPSLVALRGAFVSNELDGHDALIFVHDYHPGAMTLEQMHLQPTATAAGLVRNAASEEQLWSYLMQVGGQGPASRVRLCPQTAGRWPGCILPHPGPRPLPLLPQLTAALRAVHCAGLALHAGCLGPSKVLVNGLGKVRVSCCGIVDTLVQDSPSPDDLAQLQRRDLKVGWCRGPSAAVQAG
jgi:PAB-dependent poly(A)-specific ribonuclease subunit 3